MSANLTPFSSDGGFSTAGNVVAENVLVVGSIGVSGTASPAPTISGFGLINSVTISASGNITGGNISTAGDIVVKNIEANGNIQAGNALITGNLLVQGTTTTVNSNNVSINDLVFNVANNANSAIFANGAGLGVGPVDAEYATFTWVSTSNTWTASNNLSAVGNIQGNVILGNGSQLTGMYSNTNVAAYLPTYSGNVSGTLITNSQPYITTVGTLGSLAVTNNINANGLGITGNATIGNLVVTGNVTLPGNINQITGNQGSFFGDVYGFGALYAGISSGFANLPATVTQFSANYPDYAQINFQNINSGSGASADYVVTADIGTNTTHYADFGIASSTYDGLSANALGTSVKANDAYLYTFGNTAGDNGGNLILGAGTTGKQVKVIAGGGAIANIVAVFANTGLTVAGLISSTGTVSGDNLTTAGAVSAAGNITGANINTSGAVSATGDVTGANINTAGSASVTGNVQAGNLRTTGTVSATGNVTGNVFVGNGSQLSNVVAISLANGTTNVDISTANGNITMSVAGSSNFNLTSNSVAIGSGAGNNIQQANSIAIGTQAGANSQAGNSIAFGTSAGKTNQGLNSIAVGVLAAQTSQGNNAIAIGNVAGANTQGQQSVAIGYNAGNVLQGPNSVAIGSTAASYAQGYNAIAIGNSAGNALQGSWSIAIGNSAGISLQGGYDVAIGVNAGANSQNNYAVAIGTNAGQNSQGANAIAIGTNAGSSNQANNSIVLNASGNALDAVNSGLYINPIRNDVGNISTTVYYNTTTKELTYAASSAGSYGNTDVSNYLASGTNSANIVTSGTVSAGYITGPSSTAGVALSNYKDTVTSLSYASTLTPNVALGGIFSVTLTGNVTINAFGGTPQAGQSATLILTQDATGNRVLSSTMKFAGGNKTLSTSANAIDLMYVFYDGTTYYATLSKGFQ